MTASFDIVALGEPMVEFNQVRPGAPEYLQGFGGDTSNAAIAAARAGARTAYLTRLGDDTFGEALRALWAREGVDASAVETDPHAPTGLYFVTHGPTGHAFTYRRAGSAAARMTPHWLRGAPAAVIRHAQVLHVSGISLAISPDACETALEAMALARDAGVQVAFDSNLRLKLWPLARARDAIDEALALTDIFLPSLEDITILTGLEAPEAILDWGHRAGAKTVVLKLGAQGCIASDGRETERIAPLRVTALDATGAGDCFAGNFLARVTRGDTLAAAARYANAAAALSVQGYGAVAPLPRPHEVEALL